MSPPRTALALRNRLFTLWKQKVACRFSTFRKTAAATTHPSKPSTSHISECFDRISQQDPYIRAFISVTDRDSAVSESQRSETRRQSGTPLSRIDGVPIAIKDNICTKALPTTCASKMLEDFRSPFDATVVKLIRGNGGVVMGKTNMDEFGMGSANVFSAYGPTINPFPISNSSAKNMSLHPVNQRVAGGSSGGSAAAIAAKMCDAALGSDTGGSVRLPASYCGVVGFKPSYGLVSRYGLVAYANSLDTVGILAKDVECAVDLFDVVSKHDENDSTCMSDQLRSLLPKLDANSNSEIQNLKGVRIGIPKEYILSELGSPVLSAWRKCVHALRKRGAEIVNVSCPNTRHGLGAYYVIAAAEASSNLARYDGIEYGYRSPRIPSDPTRMYADTRYEGFGAEVRRRILLGTFVLSAGAYEGYFLQAQRVRRLVQQDFDNVFSKPSLVSSSPETYASLSSRASSRDKVDALLTPVSIDTAPRVQDAIPESDVSKKDANITTGPEKSTNNMFVDAYVNDVMTIPASLAGIPAISVPFGRSSVDGYPIGLQVLGQHGDEGMVFRVAKAVESAGRNSI